MTSSSPPVELLARLLDSVSVGITVLSGPELRHTLCNPAFQVLVGVQAGQLAGLPLSTALPTLAASGVERWAQGAYTLGETVSVREAPLQIRPGGERCWWDIEHVPLRDEDGRVEGVLVLVHDVSTSVRTRQEAAVLAAEAQALAAELRDSERRLRQLADAMPQVVWTARPDGTVDYYNERANEYDGFTRRPDGTWTWEPVLHPEDVQRTLEAWRDALATGTVYECRHRVRTRAGEYRWHLSRGVPLHNAAGEITRWFGTATDVHDPKPACEQAESIG